MHVGDLDGATANNGKTWTATATAQIDDGGHGPVANATVSWSAGLLGTATCVTDLNGRCSVAKAGIPKKFPTATFTVTNVAHATRAYQPSADHDADGDSNGISITVPKP